MSTENPVPDKYPSSIGIAADLVFQVCSIPAYLCDCLLLYDELVIPVEQFTLHRLFAQFTVPQVRRLSEEGRIKFCLGLSHGVDQDLSADALFENISNSMRFGKRYSVNDTDTIISLVQQNLLLRDKADYSRWLPLLHQAEKAFFEAAERPLYNWLYPIDRRTGNPNRDHVVGLESGLARINDLVAIGMRDMDFDLELTTLLDVCFPAADISAILSTEARRLDPVELARTLHRIEHLPPIGDMIRSGRWTIERAIGAVTSGEAQRLRDWLKINVAPGIDVRDAFISSLATLPSKKEWAGWTRFGVVTTVSTVISSLLTANPVLGTSLGVALGAADQKYGSKVTERLSDEYHPREWFSFVKRLNPGNL